MIKWYSVKKQLPKLKKTSDIVRVDDVGKVVDKFKSNDMASDRLLVWITDHIGIGSYTIFRYKTSEGVHEHAFWNIEGHSVTELPMILLVIVN